MSQAMNSRDALELTEQQEIDALPLCNDLMHFLAREGHTPYENTNVAIGALCIALAKMLAGKNRTYVERTWGVVSGAWWYTRLHHDAPRRGGG